MESPTTMKEINYVYKDTFRLLLDIANKYNLKEEIIHKSIFISQNG